MGLKEPFSFEELEAELIDPWSSDTNTVEKTVKVSASLQGKETTKGHTCQTGVTDLISCKDFTFIQVQTESMKESANTKAAPHIYGSCTGVVLTKAHVSLLKVLVGELLSKVVASSDSKQESKRGKRKEVENPTSVKKPKINMLPINELTWPELARRYVLAVSFIKCNMDSAEIPSHEGAKVFRCLQGDGGILCGSLPGLAGMEADAQVREENIHVFSIMAFFVYHPIYISIVSMFPVL